VIKNCIVRKFSQEATKVWVLRAHIDLKEGEVTFKMEVQ